MMEDDLTDRAVAQLRDAGFLVERDVRKSAGRTGRQMVADVLAHAGTEDGELALDVLVEVKPHFAPELLESQLAHASRTASVFGTRRAFLFDGRWFAIDASFRSATPCDCPRPAIPARGAKVPDELVARRLWQLHDRLRSAGRGARVDDVIDAVIDEKQSTTSPLSMALASPLGAARLAQHLAGEPETNGPSGVPVALADAMAQLLAPRPSWTVLDPAAGPGGCLWATRAHAISRGFDVALHGSDPNVRFKERAEKLASLIRAPITYEARPLAETIRQDASVDGIVSAPPMNVRLLDSVTLSTGQQTIDADLALVDAVTRWLRPGGRAVLAVVPRLLSSGGSAERLRAHIVRTARVTAVVELPAGVLPEIAVRVPLLVIDKCLPGDTLLADLGEDWQTQLSPGGAFLRAYHEHVASWSSP